MAQIVERDALDTDSLGVASEGPCEHVRVVALARGWLLVQQGAGSFEHPHNARVRALEHGEAHARPPEAPGGLGVNGDDASRTHARLGGTPTQAHISASRQQRDITRYLEG